VEEAGEIRDNQGCNLDKHHPPIMDLPTYQDVVDASKVLHSVAHHTPIQTSRILDGELGVNAYIKCENFQRMGAFKFRGGYNAISHYNAAGDLKHVLTYSSGNHAQAIALASTMLGVKSTIIMPTDAPSLKLKATQSYGGDIVFYDRYKEKRDEVAERVKLTLPAVGTEFIPPYDHKYVIAGQGTVGKEMIEDLQSESITLDYLFVCVGGGGLISGICLAAKALSPHTKIIGVEPEAGNDAQQSLQQGRIVHIETPRTIADGAQTQHLGELTFAIMSRNVSQIITVTDEELVDGMKFFGETMKMVVEPTGCLGLAGLRKMVKGGEILKDSNCGVVISGGNIDLKRYCELILSSLT
jgi:threonine dehydratase